ncbi:SoxR reducing system RseC family protein [Endozoicomonas elysicola]|uniref:SoxR reducing system RseC family protein n=1 Tax=Endozoicomonas elysicola TaxID=305900 RepID=UPI000378721A|nr:SoxR reducing system RseC family protein [Endozoicomonas elysicola]
MVEEQGRVVTVESEYVWVETTRRSSCSSCNARQGCGQHLSEKYKSDAYFSYIKASSRWVLKEGDQVVVGIPEGSLLKASFLIYLFPLILLMVGLWLSSLAGLSDFWLVLTSGFSLLCGFFFVRIVGEKRSADICRVEVVKVLSPEGLFFSDSGVGEQFAFRHD